MAGKSAMLFRGGSLFLSCFSAAILQLLCSPYNILFSLFESISLYIVRLVAKALRVHDVQAEGVES